MNRLMVLGLAAFFGLVSVAMLSVDNKAVAGRGCSCDCGGQQSCDCGGRVRRSRGCDCGGRARRRNTCCAQPTCNTCETQTCSTCSAPACDTCHSSVVSAPVVMAAPVVSSGCVGCEASAPAAGVVVEPTPVEAAPPAPAPAPAEPSPAASTYYAPGIYYTSF